MRLLLVSTSLAALATHAWAGDLTLHRVMLSAAGVGYFEFGASVVGSGPGAGTIGLDVPLAQVDDVLRSLAVFDDHGGIGSIELPGRDNTRQAFADVPFDAQQLNTPMALLQSLRGQEIAVSGPVAMQGSIVSVVGDDAVGKNDTRITHTRVTLLTPSGFQQFILEDATAIKLTDAALNAHIGAALQAARQQTASATRHLILRSEGQGPRQISVGYVAEAPLWKASYRVVLPASGGDHARVQGWAVLENQSGVDWKGVDLTLQSGNPVTFHQAIYASYYASRPEVPVEVLGHLLPEPDERATASGMISAVQGAVAPSFEPEDGDASVRVQAQRRMMPMRAGKGANGVTGFMFAPMPAPAPAMAAPMEQAQASETVVDTSFHIPTPIDLARGNTASVPILDKSIPAEQLDLLPARSTRPITALRLTNTLPTSLPAGILTLYTTTPNEGAAFAGDARLSGLPAGQSRLLAFAEDLRTTATRTTSTGPDTVQRVKLVDGILTQSILHRTIMTVTLTAPVHEARRVLVEFPKIEGATFVLPDGKQPGQEETSTAWRVPVDLKAGDTRRITAYADTPDSTSEVLLPKGGDFDNDVLVGVLSEPSLDTATRTRLQSLADLRGIETAKQDALRKLTDERDAVITDEQRLRANIQAVFNPGDLRDKLLAQLAADEADLARLRDAIKPAQAEVDAAHAALLDAVRRLVL